MKITIVHSGSEHEIFPLMSLLIGLSKHYSDCSIIWIGLSQTADLLKYNKRISNFLDVSDELTLNSLQIVFGTDICVNVAPDRKTRKFSSSLGAAQVVGFDKNGATSHRAEFFNKVMTGEISTKKTLLQIYYDLLDLRWRGEGYGLSYYPKSKQTKSCGYFLEEDNIEQCTKIKLPSEITRRLDVLNQFDEIYTDDLFVLHAGIALRKQVHLLSDNLPYRIEFFGRGSVKPKGYVPKR